MPAAGAGSIRACTHWKRARSVREAALDADPRTISHAISPGTAAIPVEAHADSSNPLPLRHLAADRNRKLHDFGKQIASEAIKVMRPHYAGKTAAQLVPVVTDALSKIKRPIRDGRPLIRVPRPA